MGTHDLLVLYYKQQTGAKDLYDQFRAEFHRQVLDLSSENSILRTTYTDPFPDLQFQFFHVDTENSTHFRVVSLLGTIVYALDTNLGKIDAIVHLHHDSDLGDLSSIYKLVGHDDNSAILNVDRNGERVILDVAEEVQLALWELLFPSVTSQRIRATPQERV